MSLPVVFIDVLLLAAILAAALAVGLLIGWLAARRRRTRSGPDDRVSEARPLLKLMSRADHTLDNYITSIQGHLSVLGDALPTDPQRWQTSRDAIGQAAAQMKRHTSTGSGWFA